MVPSKKVCTIVEPNIDLPADLFKDVFPYHIVLDREFKVLQLGHKLKFNISNRPEGIIGVHVENICTIVGPKFCPWDWNVIFRSNKDQTFQLETIPNEDNNFRKIPLSGKCIPCNTNIESQNKNYMAIFLLNLRVSKIEELIECGLTLTDIPHYTVQRELIFASEHLSAELESTSKYMELAKNLREEAIQVETARHQEMFQMKNAFVRYISHEMRTPLNIVSMGIQMLDEEAKKREASGRSTRQDRATAEMISDMRGSCSAAVNILDDLLLYERVENNLLSLDLKETHIQEVAKTAIQPFQIQAKSKGVALTTDLGAAERVLAELDAGKVRQALANLMSNAIKFTPCGGSVHVSAEVIVPPQTPPVDFAARTNFKLPPISTLSSTKTSCTNDPQSSPNSHSVSFSRRGSEVGRAESCKSERRPNLLRELSTTCYSEKGPASPLEGREDLGPLTVNNKTRFDGCAVTAVDACTCADSIEQRSEHSRGRDRKGSLVSRFASSSSMYSMSEGDSSAASEGKQSPFSQIEKNFPPFPSPSRLNVGSFGSFPSFPSPSRRDSRSFPSPSRPGSGSHSSIPSPSRSGTGNSHFLLLGPEGTGHINGYLRISVRDTGPGISQEDQRLLFTQFAQIRVSRDGEEAERGAGLGLWLASSILSAHKGSVTVQSDGLGRGGSVFHIHIPISGFEDLRDPECCSPSNSIEEAQSDKPSSVPAASSKSNFAFTASSAKSMPQSLKSPTAIGPLPRHSLASQFRLEISTSPNHSSAPATNNFTPTLGSTPLCSSSSGSGSGSGSNATINQDRYQSPIVRPFGSPVSRPTAHAHFASIASPIARVSPVTLPPFSRNVNSPGSSSTRQIQVGNSTSILSPISTARTVSSKRTMSPTSSKKITSPVGAHAPSIGSLLVVDDSLTNRKFVRRLLSPHAQTLEEARDGQEAVDMCDGRAEYDVIMMDFVMPVMDGPNSVRELRRRGYRGLIIGVTGNSQQVDIDEFMNAGCDRVMIKPLDIYQFLAYTRARIVQE